MMENKKKIMGICQICGKSHAVVGGLMAIHGYKVENGWFSVSCKGRFYAPMQLSRAETDNIVREIHLEVSIMIEQLRNLESGKTKLDLVNLNDSDKFVKWEDLSRPTKQYVLKKKLEEITKRINHLCSSAARLEDLADEFHGKPMPSVSTPVKPEPIRLGDIKIMEDGQPAKVIGLEKQSVFWKSGKNKGVIRSALWRKLPKE